MLSFHVKFVQTDRRTDNGEQYAPDLLMRGHKRFRLISQGREKFGFCGKDVILFKTSPCYAYLQY